MAVHGPEQHVDCKLLDASICKVKGESNISFICSRYNRAHELIFGATEYPTAIDIWSGGCVLAELLLGQDPALQQELKQYLISRGISNSLTTFLLHIHSKEQDQYIKWLQKLEAMAREGLLKCKELDLSECDGNFFPS
ncbi:hypothetical protein L1987_01769 [Smallanthus sonchifolius]|uniref:Uncharacterized protein n=1 Tax=Smallanthus sonchifolius TaxID=185202 RepID=A0ACB9K5W0_9ASTR|nr:hypothetical protein L1987_01769 [Smallanthus sonchifolius]